LSGLSATTVPDQFWTQNTPNVNDLAEMSDFFGNSLSAGDFNGDGFDDLAIGVGFEDLVSLFDDAGAVNIIYGSLSGLSATTVPDQFWTQNTPNVADSSEDFDGFGRAVTSSDFNGDGRDDLAIGVDGENDAAGAVNVIYGSLSGLSATTVPDQFWTQNTPNVADSSESLDFFGARLT
jgi:hypothetical protein